jgi:MobA/MobL family
MSFYRFEAKIISRGSGRSTVEAASYRSGKWATAIKVYAGRSVIAAAAYRHADVLEDERTGQRYDYSRKRGVLGAEIMLPEGAPSWMVDRSALWNAVEIIEKRKDAQLARDFVISLPHELSHDQRVALTRNFVREQFCAQGFVADIAWHAPSKAEGLNWHAHVMVTMRKVEDTGFAAKKERPASDGLKHPALIWKEELMRLRVAWADTANRHLEAAGLDVRIDHRSLEARGIDREPEPKQGPLAMKIEQEGRESRAGTARREVQARNAERARLKVEHAEAIAEEKRIVDMMTHRLKGDEIKPEPPTEELLRQQQKREMDLLREMRDQDVRLQAFKQQAQQDAEEAKREQAETARDEERRHREGDIGSAAARYSIALGEQYDVRDPYGSLARAAMQEYAMFHRRQEQMREEIAKEQDPEKRRIIELKRMIEGYEYMVITSERLAEMSVVITGREDSPQAVLDHARARAYHEWAQERREERSRLIEEQEKRNRANASDPQRAPDEPARPTETTRSNDNKREEAEDEERQKGKLGGRREGPVEMSDAKREKLAKLAETEAAYAEHDAAKQQQREHGTGDNPAGSLQRTQSGPACIRYMTRHTRPVFSTFEGNTL